MGKWFLRAGFVIIISSLMSYLPPQVLDKLFSKDFIITIYTVIGIMFPLGLNQIMSFSFTAVERDAFVCRYRGDLDKIRNIFVCLFIISTIVFLLKFIDFAVYWKYVKYDIRCFYLTFFVFSLTYYVINFISLAKLKNEIEDKIRAAKKEAQQQE